MDLQAAKRFLRLLTCVAGALLLGKVRPGASTGSGKLQNAEHS